MTDELVKRLLSLADCDARSGEPLGKCMREAAASIKQLERELSISRMAQVVMDNSVAEVEGLQAKNMRLSGMCYDLKKEVAISDALLISEAEASLDRLARAEKAEAENARLREVLLELIKHTHNCERELTEDLHHVDFCGESMPLTNARDALIEKPVVTK